MITQAEQPNGMAKKLPTMYHQPEGSLPEQPFRA